MLDKLWSQVWVKNKFCTTLAIKVLPYSIFVSCKILFMGTPGAAFRLWETSHVEILNVFVKMAFQAAENKIYCFSFSLAYYSCKSRIPWKVCMRVCVFITMVMLIFNMPKFQIMQLSGNLIRNICTCLLAFMSIWARLVITTSSSLSCQFCCHHSKSLSQPPSVCQSVSVPLVLNPSTYCHPSFQTDLPPPHPHCILIT